MTPTDRSYEARMCATRRDHLLPVARTVTLMDILRALFGGTR